MKKTKYKKGVLLLADVVNYTTQSNQLGAEKTSQFNKNLEEKVKVITAEYNGDFIKTIGDALLIFFKEEEDFLDFASRLRDLSRYRQLDHGEFFADLRMAAHMGKFSFEFFREKIADLIGPGGITVFRIEKYAHKHDVVITGTVLDFLEDSLKQKNIHIIHLGRERLKGFDKETDLYKLVFPEKDEKITTNLLRFKMECLEQDTKEIPVFGELYPAISMEENFINLDVRKARYRVEYCSHDWEQETDGNTIDESDGMMEVTGVHFKGQGRLHGKKAVGSANVDVKNLYEKYYKGVILGLPGAGKTTILKYFAYRDLKANREMEPPAAAGKEEVHEIHQIHEKKDKRVVLFIECRNMMNFNQRYRKKYNGKKAGENLFNIETILNHLAYCFLFNKEKKNKEKKQLEKAEKLVQQAYYNGRLSILLDALDEARSKEIKKQIIDCVKALFSDCEDAKRKTNRIYLTARLSEREAYFEGKDAEILQPLFEVRPLDMEQLRQIARFFYKDKPQLYKEFDSIVWREEIAVKVGGTPLTALLVIAYFEIFRKFDTRFHMYNIIVTFILVQVWKHIKEEHFDKDMKTFFTEAKSKTLLKEEKHAGIIYDALSLACCEHLEKGRVINEEDLTGVFEIFALHADADAADPWEHPGEIAENWLNHMKQDHLLLSAGPNEYVFIHSNVMEYLAARYIVEKMKNPLYLDEQFENKDIEKGLSRKNFLFFKSDIIPIAVGSGIEIGARLLGFIKQCIENADNEKTRKMFYHLALRSLAEFESFIHRSRQRKKLDLLHRDMEKQIKANWNAMEWIYEYLKNMILTDKKEALESAKEDFKNFSTLSMSYFLQNFLDFETYANGDSQLLALREELLCQIINRELVDDWLKKNREEKERLFLKRERLHQSIMERGGLLTLDPVQYHPGDKNFTYYREFTGNVLTGFLGSPNLRHNSAVKSAAVSACGKYIISGSEDNTIKLWETATGREVRTFRGHSGWVWSVDSSPDGKYIVSGSYDHTLKLWEKATGREIRTFKGHTNWVTGVCFSTDGKYIVSGSWDKTIKLWNTVTGSEVCTFEGHEYAVTGVGISADGKYIISGSYDNTMKLWKTAAGVEMSTFKGHEQPVWSVAFSGDARYAVSGSRDCTLKLWEIATGKELRTFNGHGSYVDSVRFSSDGTYIISGSWDNTVKLWETAGGREVRTFKGHGDGVTGVCFSNDNKKIVSCSTDGSVKLWDSVSGREAITFNGHNHPVWSVGFSADGRQVVSASSDCTVKLWDAINGKELRTFKGHGSGVTGVCFSNDAKFIISGSSDNTVKLWDTEAGREVRTFKGHTSYVNSVNTSPDSKYIISGSSDNTVKLWEALTGREVRNFIGHISHINSVSFSPDGRSIISGSRDNTVKLWDIATGTEIRNFKGHTGNVNSVGFIPGGKYILSGSADQTVKIWEIATGREVKTLKGHSGGVWCVCFSKGGQNIISCSDDYTIKIWDPGSGACIRTIDLLWIPVEIRENPCQPGCFASANLNGTVTFFDFRDMMRGKTNLATEDTEDTEGKSKKTRRK